MMIEMKTVFFMIELIELLMVCIGRCVWIYVPKIFRSKFLFQWQWTSTWGFRKFLALFYLFLTRLESCFPIQYGYSVLELRFAMNLLWNDVQKHSREWLTRNHNSIISNLNAQRTQRMRMVWFLWECRFMHVPLYLPMEIVVLIWPLNKYILLCTSVGKSRGRCLEGLPLWRNNYEEINYELFRGYMDGNEKGEINEIMAGKVHFIFLVGITCSWIYACTPLIYLLVLLFFNSLWLFKLKHEKFSSGYVVQFYRWTQQRFF